MNCTVCHHPQLSAIDLALLAGHTLESLHRQYGPSKSALHRHKNHVQEKMRRSQERLESSRQLVSLLKLSAFLDHVQRGVEAAAAEDDINKVFKGCQIGSRLIKQINQMELPLDLGAVYLLISSSGFASQDSILPAGPQIIADLHQALVDYAFSPCPDLPPECAPGDEAEGDIPAAGVGGYNETEAAAEDISSDPFLETRESEPETPLSNPSSLIPDPCLLDLSPAELAPAAYDPKNQREKSGKLSRQKRRLLKKSLRNQKDISNEKNLAKKPGVGRENEVHPAALESGAPPANQDVTVPPASPEIHFSEFDTPFSETGNQEPKTGPNPWLSPDLDPWLSPVAEPCSADLCLTDPPPDSLETRNPELKTPPPETEPQKPGTKPPPPYDETARRADELFEISHAYKRHNPPKTIPNRRRDEDFRSNTIFGDPKKIFG
jgi:hypothetical protein